jgi:CRISPR-associated protein Cmr3
MPSTVAGHIRTRLWQPRSFDPKVFREDKEKKSLLSVTQIGPFLACDTENDGWELAFPAPADAAVYRVGGSLQVVPLRPARSEHEGFGCDLPDGLRPLRGAKTEKATDDAPVFWTAEQSLLWLQTRATQTWLRSDAEIGYEALPEQSRIHVEIERNRRNAKEGMLFRTVSREFDFQSDFRRSGEQKVRRRLRKRAAVYSRVEGEGFEWSDTSGGGALGGERRLARWSETVNMLPRAPETQPEEGLLRIQLVTPAIFTDGWRPGWMTTGEPPGCAGLELDLVGAAIPRYQAVSGFDMTARGNDRFRETRFITPAGSVYFFRIVQGDARQLWLKAVSDGEQDRRDGFGIVLTGGWQWR